MQHDPELDSLDRAAPVRPGEDLHTERLAAYLHAHLPGNGSGAPPPLIVEQFPRGYSNLTYLLRLGDRELVLRRPPFGANIKSAHDMGREYRILRGLEGVYAKVPQPLLYCDDERVLGAPFYVMARVGGVILRERLPVGLTVAPGEMRRICESLVATLAELHAVDFAGAGLADLGKAEGYVARQVRGWTQRYANAATHDLAEMAAVAQWLAEHMPPERGAALIHNDFKLDNLVLAAEDLTQVRAVLDWEMATIGDPLMDLGTTLGYWIQAGDPPELQRIGLARFDGSLRRSEVVAHYARCTGRDPQALAAEMVYYYVFGLFKIAVIAQQIYYRFRQGFTQDPRFGALDTVVAACAGMAQKALVRGRIE
jgi:aminoglycoside phosphotransferase (APT) family kinase protein